MLPETVMQNGQNLPRHFDVILGHVDRFETDQKALTPAPAGTAAPTGPATALASPGTSRTELMRVFYVVLYPYRADSPLLSGWPGTASTGQHSYRSPYSYL